MTRQLFAALFAILPSLTAFAETQVEPTQPQNSQMGTLHDACRATGTEEFNSEPCDAYLSAVHIQMTACMKGSHGGLAGHRARYLSCTNQIEALFGKDGH